MRKSFYFVDVMHNTVYSGTKHIIVELIPTLTVPISVSNRR